MGRGGTTAPSLARFPAWPAGGAPAPAPKPSLEQDFFFSHPHRNQRSVSGHSAGRGVEGKKSPVAPGVSLASQSQPPPAQCRFTTGCTGVQEMSTGGCKAGATPTGPSCSTTASAPPGTVCRAPPPPMRRDPRWSSCHPPRTPHPQNPHFPSRLPLYPHSSPQPPPPR